MTKRITVTAEDHARITAAVRAAESRTSGEIFAVVAHASDGYFFVSGFMVAIASILVTALLAFWPGLDVPASALLASQLVALIVALATLRVFPHLRLFLVPRAIAFRRASANAVRQFLAHGIHATSERTGVLIFVSIAEHYVEVIADHGIDAKVEQMEWDRIVDGLSEAAARGDLAEGFIEAIEAGGVLLARHFPPMPKPVNELDDRLVELG